MVPGRWTFKHDRFLTPAAHRCAQAPVTRLVIWLCVGVFAATALLDLLHVIGRPQIISLFGLSSYGLFHRLWLHQVATAPFFHANVIHLVFNMLSLWMLGGDVERRLGTARYCVLSAVSALCGSTAFLFVDGSGTTIGIGYSAVIFGLLVAEARARPNVPIMLFFSFQMKMRYAALLLGAIELYLTVTSEGGPANAAHLFGAVGAYCYLKGPQWLRPGRNKSYQNNAESKPQRAKAPVPKEL